MTALTVADAPLDPPVLRRLPIPLAEPRAALSVVADPDAAVPDAQQALVLVGADRPACADPAGPTASAVAPPAGWARQFVQAPLEVCAGRRPSGRLVRWTSEDVYATLARRAALSARLDRTGTTVPATLVRSARLSRPADGVVEASAVVVDRGRVRAVALRMEELAGRWRVTALEIG